ncbi:MAG TPA: hypothetical protein VGW57_00375 [Chthoniobacterales bacterium]|nr:hypothetical protein [Chthoniobacterales bacterium]
MRRIITKQHARDIADKLKAVLQTSKKQRPHDLYTVYEDGILVATFGIRRGSNNEAGHDHLPKQLFVGPRDAKDLAQCPMSREQYIRKLRQKGRI